MAGFFVVAMDLLKDLAFGGGRGGFGQDVVMDGEERQFEPVRNADLVVDVAKVVLDDLLCSAKLNERFPCSCSPGR